MRKASKIAAALFTAVATLAAGLGMGATAYAETPTGTATIELNTNSNVDLTKTTFVAYPLIYLTGQPQAGSDDTLTSVASSPVSSALTADLKAALTAEGVTVAPGSTPEATFLALKSTDQAKIARIASALAKSPNLGSPISSTGATATKVTFSNLANGYYLIKTDPNPGDKTSDVTIAPTLVPSTIVSGGKTYTKLGTMTLGQADLKAESGNRSDNNMKKTVKSDSEKSDSAYTQNRTLKIGDTADFKLTFTVPNPKSQATFKVIDTYKLLGDPTEMAITVDGSDVSSELTVTQGTGTFTVQPKDTTFSGEPEKPTITGHMNEDGTKIASASDFVTKYAGKVVTITYKQAVLKATGTDKVADNSFTKTVYDYDGNGTPTKDDGGETSKVYNYTIALKKVDLNGNALQGAKFVVKQGDDYLKQDSTTKAWSKASSKEDATQFTTAGTEGELSISGLDYGTYSLEEVAAPEGYMLSPMGVPVVANVTLSAPDAEKDGTVDMTKAKTVVTAGTSSNGLVVAVSDDKPGSKPGVSYVDLQDGTTRATVKNIKSLTELPATGGTGAIALLLLVAVLLGAGSAVALGARKARKNAELR
ncbi:SpaA isopeptide-forming pilin-related protein [Aeriscardovia aeriphila]|uniref:Peptidase n=1 Tax=Aeriscardovia aeriphila TaxID=218139 RepID=A0A261F8C0_9BIFI|nr:SpaA isopeptide-forming pilin-related protein [Aeriscardovia aeriphila]NYI25075.1 LPXTG-motif cell wall-anchored protein [Aeriscardovia aeriphila]OZG55136.1 peptidase [Aeriscardovia aeriphila]